MQPYIPPALLAFQRAQAIEREKAAQDQAAQLGQLQQVGALQRILGEQQDRQQKMEIRGFLSRVAQETGGDPSKMGPVLMRSGDPKLMALGQKMMPKAAENYTLGPDQTRFDAQNNPIAYGTPKEKELKALPVRHRPLQVGSVYFDVTEEMRPDGTWNEIGRKPIKDPTIVMPKQPHYERGVGPNGNVFVTPIVDGKPGQPIDTGVKPQGLTTSGNQQALALRREFNMNPEVKTANMLEPRVGPIAEYVASVGTGMGNAVGDAELVKLWLMTTHPKGDQISNLDHRQIQDMPDLWGRVKNVAGNFVFGKTLDADTRADMWRSISQKYKSTAGMRDKVKNDITARGRSMNIDQSLIFSQPPVE